MKLLFKLFILLFIISNTTISCVSNYVANNNQYKYPSTNELLSRNSYKGPNAYKSEDKNLITDKSLLDMVDLKEDVDLYTEKVFTQEAYSLITEAKTYLGTPYLYGGTTRNGIDCSSFVQHVFNSLDITLPRTSVLQAKEGSWVSKDELQKGDLIFFAHTPKSRISHVGIVESVSPSGEVFFIHASSSHGVTITSLDVSSYWRKRFRTGKRILNLDEILKSEKENQDGDYNCELVKS